MRCYVKLQDGREFIAEGEFTTTQLIPLCAKVYGEMPATMTPLVEGVEMQIYGVADMAQLEVVKMDAADLKLEPSGR